MALLGGLVLGLGGQANAESIDRVEVRQAGQEAEIVIWFEARTQYQRHAPLSNGKLLQLFLMQTGTLAPTVSAVPETLTQSAPGLLAAPVTLTYPDLNGALSVGFDRKTTWRVKPGQDQRSISIFVPISAQPAKAEPVVLEAAVPEAPKPAPVSVSQVPPAWEKDARALMAQVKDAAKRGDHVAAIEQLNRLLNMPPNAYSEEAQIMIAEEREANGEFAKATAEYTLYTKLYPDGAYAAKAKQRLAAIGKATPVAEVGAKPEKRAPARREFDTGWELSGSLTQNYYHGNSHDDTLTTTVTAPGELVFDRSTLTATNQSALVTSLDMVYRRRTTDSDSRFVLRDTDTRNFLKGQDDDNRLNAAYFERNDKANGYLLRLGRQTAGSGGVLGRFDGVWGGYNLGSSWRANAVVGYPVEYNVDWRKSFFGTSLDMLPQAEKITGSAYAIVQRVDGVDDRRAVGLEARYFDSRANYFGLLDYDVMFDELNIAMLQGNYQMASGVNLFFLIDHRKSPLLQLTNGVISYTSLLGTSTTTSLKQQLAAVGASEVRNRALAQAPDADLFQLGFTKQVSPRFQFGADYRLAKTSGSTLYSMDVDTGVVSLTPQAGSGDSHVYSFQAIGNSLLRENDIGVANLSLIRAPTYDGTSATLSHTLNLERWRIDSILGYYAQEDDNGRTLRRWNPVFRLSYRVRDNWYIESELGMEDSLDKTVTPIGETKSRRTYFFVGYRWDW